MQIKLFGWRIRFDPRKPLQRELDTVKPALIACVRDACDRVIEEVETWTPDDLRLELLRAVQALPVSSAARDLLRLKVLDWDIPPFSGEALKVRLMQAEGKLVAAINGARF